MAALAELSFDLPAYEQIRLEGVRSYIRLYGGLQSLDQAQSNPVRGREWEAARLRALQALQPPHRQLPLRTLALLGGNATWGALETFFNQPIDPDLGQPVSLELREWYARYGEDLDVFFPEHREERLPSSGEWFSPDPDELPAYLQAIGHTFAAATRPRREFDSVIALVVLLRDFAEQLGSIIRSLDLSIDQTLQYLLESEHKGPSTEAVFDVYQQVLEDLKPGPLAMFVAFARTEGIPIAGEWSASTLLAAAGEEAQRPRRRDPDRTVQKHANSDLPTAEDKLGVEPLVQGLRALLDDPRTEPCLSMGITAPWGGGKSSAMFQLRRALSRPHRERHRTWIPIRFDAWKYERSERIWAALARAIYEQGQEGMKWWQRAAFRFGLERRRHGWLKLLGGPVFVLVLLLGAGILLLANSSLLPGAASIFLFLVSLGGVTAWFWGLLSNPFKRALDGYTSNPHYEEQLGFTTEADEDIRHLTALLTKKQDHVLVVFVDDLDRCSPRHLVETIEAINQIFNAADPLDESDEGAGGAPCVFVLGMDRDMVKAGIEVDYADAIDRLPPERRKNFGLQFLAKIVQLSVAVPRPDGAAIERLLDSIGAEPGTRQASGEDDGSVRERRSRNGDGVPSRLALPASAEPIEEADSEPAESEPVPFDEDSAEFQAAERVAVQYLAPNPRDVKRFDNAFRLQLHVAARTPGCKLVFDSDDLVALAKWVAMRLRWPDLANSIDSEDELLDKLERYSNSGNDDHLANLSEDHRAWADDPDVIALLKDENISRRIARLQTQQFLQIS